MLTRDDVIRMARDAGIQQVIQHAGGVLVIPDAVLERFAAAAYAAGAAAEREVCDAKHAIRSKDGFPREASTARALAKEIRQRATDPRAPGCVQPGAGAGCQAPCRCGPDGCSDSACPGRCAPVPGNVPMHITGQDGHSVRIKRSYWHEGVLCVIIEEWPAPRTMTDADLADCGLLSELD